MDHPLAAPQAALDRQEVDNGATPDLLNDENILNEATEDFRYLCKQLEEERDEMHGKVIKLTSLLEEKDIELQTAFDEAAEMLQNERDGFANSEEGYELQMEELAMQLEEAKDKLANIDTLQTNAFEEGMNAANRTQSDIQVELEAFSLQLDEAKEEIVQLKSGRAYHELESKVEDLTADLTKERTNSQAQMALFTDQIEDARNEGHNRVEEVRAECAKAHEEIFDQLMKDFASEKEEIEAHGKAVFEEEVTKLLSSLEHKESLLDASLSREESLRAQVDELTNNLAATRADFEDMKANFHNAKANFETEKEAMIISHQSAISDAQRHFAEERDKLETSMHDVEIAASQEDDKVTMIRTELVSVKEEKDKLSEQLVQVQNEKVELQDSNKAIMEEIESLKVTLDHKIKEAQNEKHNRVEEVKAECSKVHEEYVNQLMKDFSSEKEEIEAHGKEVFEEEVTKLLSSLEHEKALTEASLSREESLRAQVDELTNNLAATHARFEDLKANFNDAKANFETEKEAMIISHQSAISDAQRHFAEERDKLETSMRDVEIAATQKDDKVTVIRTELVSVKEEKDKLSEQLVQVQNEKVELQSSNKAIMEEIESLKVTLEHEKALTEASLSREESLRAQVDELTNNLAATHADFEDMKANFDNAKANFETEKEAMITSHQSAISDAQRHFAEERDKLETSMHDVEIAAAQKDDKVTVIQIELESVKEEKDKLSEQLVQVQNEKVELQDSNEAIMEEIEILKSSLDKKNEENQKLQSMSPSHTRYSPVSTTRGLPRKVSSNKPVTSTSRSYKSPGSAKVDGASTLRKFSTPSVAKVTTSSTYQNKAKPKVSSTNSTLKRTPLSTDAKNNQLLGTTTFTSRNVSMESTEVRVLFCMKHTDIHKKIVTTLGGSVVDIDDASSATHVIAGDDKTAIRRTPRLMIGICVTANILSMEWLVSSKRSRRFIETRPFLLLHDRVAERNYSFSMKETLLNGQLRRQEGGVLKDLNIYFCKKLAGNKAPKADELNLIVSCAGGNVISELSVENVNLKKIIVITSDPMTQPDLVEEQKTEPFVSEISDVFPTSWFYDVIIHQKLAGLKRGKK